MATPVLRVFPFDIANLSLPAEVVEAVQEIVNTMVVAGANITKAYDDTAGTLTITASGTGGTTDPEVVRDTIATALTPGTGISITSNDTADTITVTVSGVTISQVTGLQAALDNKTSLVETVNTVSAAGTTQTLPAITTAQVHDITLSAASCAITLPAAPAGATAIGITVNLHQDATGGRAVTWVGPGGASITWFGGNPPLVSQAANAVTPVSLYAISGAWYGAGSDPNAVVADANGHLAATLLRQAQQQQHNGRRTDTCAESAPRVGGFNTSTQVLTTQVYGTKLTLLKGSVVLGLRYWASSVGATTSFTHCFFALLDSTYTTVKRTTDATTTSWPGYGNATTPTDSSRKLYWADVAINGSIPATTAAAFTVPADGDYYGALCVVSNGSSLCAMVQSGQNNPSGAQFFGAGLPTSWTTAAISTLAGPETLPATLTPVCNVPGTGMIYVEALIA